MFHHFFRLLIAILILPVANAKIPDGIWVLDIGEHHLQPGGSIEGKLPPNIPASRNISVTASGSGGLVIPLDTLEEDGSFRFGNLPPGQWTIRIDDNGKVVARHNTEVISEDQRDQNAE